MKTEPIKELDNKYVGLFKKEDFDKLPNKYHHWLSAIQLSIDDVRKAEGKELFSKNNYVVLNLDDEIDLGALSKAIKIKLSESKIENAEELQRQNKISVDEYINSFSEIRKVKDIAIDLVNAILKAKGG